MKVFLVGGAVRDRLLGRPAKDFDFLVVGATETEFASVFPGARKVAKAFPVFLFEGCEFALARTEQNSGGGHRDFKVVATKDVTLADDLGRRDLTINAMAVCPETGELAGGFRGLHDLQHKILRHVSEAFRDDPLRVFRVARFAAQLPEFTVAPETVKLMRSMRHDLNNLSAERVWCEVQKALESQNPERFFEVLKDCDCLGQWFPEIKATIGVPVGPDSGKHQGEVDTFDHLMKAVVRVPGKSRAVERFATLCHDLGKALSESPPKHWGHDKVGVPVVQSLCLRIKAPIVFRRAAILFCQEHLRAHRLEEMRAGKAIRLLELINRSMPGGLRSFLFCSIGDGMSVAQAHELLRRGKLVRQVKLLRKDQGRGQVCAEIMMQMRCDVWKSS